jgi:drug/metabolite transporter (DMT)-like permease
LSSFNTSLQVKTAPSRWTAIGLALLVTFLWSSSWVLIKLGLEEISPLTFAGLRYMLAFVCLLPFALRRRNINAICSLTKRQWVGLTLLGIIFYGITQGAQFAGLEYLEMTSASLVLNLSGLTVALLGVIFLAELPGRIQWLGILLNLTGVIFYFYPPLFSKQDGLGIAIILVAMLANSGSALLGRRINRSGRITPLNVTFISMGIGATLLLLTGIIVEGFPQLSLRTWGIILWMSVVNTAIAFTLWNYTQRTLLAMESTIINSTMLIQIAFLGWLLMGEIFNTNQIMGIILAGVGTVLVQLRRGVRINQRSDT